jgi:hypothetical protein
LFDLAAFIRDTSLKQQSKFYNMETFEGQNWGVIRSIRVIAYANVIFDEFTNPIAFDDISYRNGANFEQIPFTFESGGFSEQEEKTPAGPRWNKKVQLTIPKLRSEVSALLEAYENRKLVLLITDRNNVSHLVYPLRITRQRNIPGPATSLNSTLVEFSGSWDREALLVSGVVDG